MQIGTVEYSIIARKLDEDARTVGEKFARDYWVTHRSVLHDCFRLEVPACTRNRFRRFEANRNIGSLAIVVLLSWSDLAFSQNDAFGLIQASAKPCRRMFDIALPSSYYQEWNLKFSEEEEFGKFSNELRDHRVFVPFWLNFASSSCTVLVQNVPWYNGHL